MVEQMLGAGASWALPCVGLSGRRTRACAARGRGGGGGCPGRRGCPRQIMGGAAGPLPGDELLCWPTRGGLCGRKGQTIISLSRCWRGHGRGQHDSRAGRGGTASHPPPAGTGPRAPQCQHPQLETEGHNPGLALSTVPTHQVPLSRGPSLPSYLQAQPRGQSCGLSAEC